MLYLKDENFKDLVKEGLWLVDFYADWCGPCKMISPIIEELDGDIDIVKINVNAHEELANEFKVMSIPTIIYFKNGDIVKKVVGFQDKTKFIKDLVEIKKD